MNSCLLLAIIGALLLGAAAMLMVVGLHLKRNLDALVSPVRPSDEET